MDRPEDDSDKDDAAADALKCSWCHRPYPKIQMSVIQGRTLCPGCAAAFFDEDADE